MGKFKVGDRVIMTEHGHEMQGSDRANPRGVVGTYDSSKDDNSGYGYVHKVKWDNGSSNVYRDGEIALYTAVTSNTIQLNQTYTSKNGTKWECIAIKGDVAWLTGAGGEAYRFKLDGTNLSQGGGVWDIKFEPVVEWVEYMSDINISEPQPDGFYIFTETAKVSIRFPKIDGVPDFAQATVTPV